MRGWLALSLVGGLWSFAQVASAGPTLELSGCSQGFDAGALGRAVELEAKGSSADYRLRAQFDCQAKGKVELAVRDPAGAVLASTVVELAALPEHTRTRLLAVVWAELIRALSLESGAREAEAGEAGEATAAQAHPASAEPARDLAHQTSTPVRPGELQTVQDDRARPQDSDFAYRQALLSWPPVEASLFAVQAGFVLLDFLRARDNFLGANFGARIGPVSVLGFYVQHASEHTSLGVVDARVWGGALELALWCGALRALELCSVASADLGRADVDGRATPKVSAGDGLGTWFAAGALGLAARVGRRWLAFEVAARGGLARGPTARVADEPVVALQGGFLALTLSAVVNP